MKAVHHDSLHNFFQTFSRVVIIAPIIIIVLAVLLKVSKSDSVIIETKIIPTKSQIPLPSISPNKRPLDLQGPSTCLFQTQEASWSAYIQNKMVFVTKSNRIQTTYYLMKDDCLYIWEKQKYSGEKICGIGQFISLGEGLFNSGLMEEGMFNMLLSQSKINLSLPFQFKDIQKIMSTCKLSSSFPLSLFALPKQVLFKSK